MPLIKDDIKELASWLYLNSTSSENSKIRELGQYDPIIDKYEGCPESKATIFFSHSQFILLKHQICHIAA
jgi:hypothetical protein